MLNKILKSILIGSFLLGATLTFSSCEKEDETVGIVIVKRSSGQLVSNAQVTLFPDPTVSTGGELPNPSLTQTEDTDANGEARFTYDLEAILNIEVTKQDGNSLYVGSNIIRLLRGKTVTKVVEIN